MPSDRPVIVVAWALIRPFVSYVRTTELCR